MKASKDAIKTARKMLDLCKVRGELELELVRKVVDRFKEEKPRGYLPMLDRFIRLVRLELAKRHAIVETPEPLTGTLRAAVEQDLKKKYGHRLTLDFKDNPDLIAGMRVRVGSDVWDGSVKSRLERLREKF